uniref:Uncharacterized protein n=1 Tax=Tetranychus urticae TaxID=32264 RepID=T1KH51_TETUR
MMIGIGHRQSTEAAPLFGFGNHGHLPVERPIQGEPISLCDGEVIGGKICIYKCKLCDMPRMFVMKYASYIG